MKVMREVVARRQESDMGSGCGYLDGAIGCTLREVLDFYANNSKNWGIVFIYHEDGNVIRKFDYDTYNNNIFYHHLGGWEYNLIVKKVKFDYCFMNKDIYIYLN